MSNQEAIKTALKGIDGASKLLGRKEIKELPKLLWEDELPHKIIQGIYGNNNGILVATNKRLIFIDKGILSLTVEDFPYDKITSLQFSTGLVFGELQIYASGNKALIKQISKQSVQPFAEWVRNHINQGGKASSKPPVGNQTDIVDQLERLTKLKEQGALTEEEFQAQKSKLLR